MYILIIYKQQHRAAGKQKKPVYNIVTVVASYPGPIGSPPKRPVSSRFSISAVATYWYLVRTSISFKYMRVFPVKLLPCQMHSI